MMRGFGLDGLFKEAAKGIVAPPKDEEHKPLCDCGCVPNVMSLMDQAKERARRRTEKAAAKEGNADAEQQQRNNMASFLGRANKQPQPSETASAAASSAVIASLVAAPKLDASLLCGPAED